MFLPEHLAQTKRLLEVFVLGALVLAFTVWTFGEQATELQPPVQTPYLLLVILTVSAFRLPRRWATLLCALMVIVATAFAAHRLGPFGLSDSPFERVLQTQLFLATATIYAFGLATVLLEKQGLVGALTTTNNRYRNFVRHSSEAVWRVELHEPLSLELPIPEQVEWLKTHAFIAECSATFEALDTGFDASVKPDTTQRAELPWPGILTDSLYRVASQGYSIRDMPFTLRKRGAVEHWLASFDGIIENGKLLRIWGVARNVTDLVRSNERLRLDQQRLRDFANQLSQAEERARRATAVDLHDGIGQLMTAAAHSLEVAARQTGGSVAKLLENSLQMLRQIHTTTRDVIADLSPPGLYDLGLEPALQWLAIRFRSQHGLQVIVDVKLQERTLDLDTRILVFKIIRELLQNVVKHAQVDRAEVRVRGEGNLLSVEVTDHGVGFEWQYELFETTSRGFGLWSIGDRVREAGGTIDIETSPGAGCRVRLSFPLRARADSQVA
jgi:signal transduction histidine kinase